MRLLACSRLVSSSISFDVILRTLSAAQWRSNARDRKLHLPRPTVLRDTALQVEDCKEVEDGRGRWDGRAPVGARPPRWRRRVHARGPTTDVGAPQTGRRAEAVAG